MARGGPKLARASDFSTTCSNFWLVMRSSIWRSTCTGDLQVDGHHTTEDVGICLGQAIDRALGDRAGIRRYGHTVLPMDEALVTAAVDLGGRRITGFGKS